MAPRTQFLPAFFATFLVIVLPCKAVPTTISSSGSDVCRVVSHGSLSYTCKSTGSSLFWKCSVFAEAIVVIGDSTTHIPELSVAGLTLTENYTYNKDLDCINSTLTFAGSLEILQTLNGLVIKCTDSANTNTDNATIVIPSLPEPPTLRIFSLVNCGGPIGTQVILEWAPPTNTGGEGVRIDHYIVNVTGPGGYTCPPDQCNVTTPSTTITGLQCNTSYTVTVRAVNCAGVSVSSTPETVNITTTPNATISPPGILKACLADNNITLRWMGPSVWSYDSSCAEVQLYTLVILNSRGGVILDTNTTMTNVSFRVPKDVQYTILLTATTVCGSSNNTITISAVNDSCLAVNDSCLITVAPGTAECSIGIGVGITTTFLLTAILSSLATFLITFLTTYHCVKTRHPNCSHSQNNDHQRPNSLPLGANPVKEVVYKSVTPVSASNLTFESCDSKSSSTEAIETKDNAAYPQHNNIVEMYDDSMKEYYSVKMSCADNERMYDTVM